jgi:hypothetical protein
MLYTMQWSHKPNLTLQNRGDLEACNLSQARKQRDRQRRKPLGQQYS